MGKQSENQRSIDKKSIYNAEIEKLHTIFAEVDEPKRELVDGLIQEAAFLYSENAALRESLKNTGMIKVHPNNPQLQKMLPAATQYLKNLNSYAVVIKTLNGILSKNLIEEDDDMEEFE